jgi:hypothetical protein
MALWQRKVPKPENSFGHSSKSRLTSLALVIAALILANSTASFALPPSLTTEEEQLRTLASLDPSTLPPDSKSSARRLLKSVVEKELKNDPSATSSWVFDTPAIEALSFQVEQSEPVLTQQIAEILASKVLVRVRGNDIPGAEAFFSWLLKRRPDPNAENDKLRLKIALAANSDKGFYFGLARTEELSRSSGLGMIGRVRLLFKGYYGRGYLLVLAVTTLLTLLVFALYRFRISFALPRIQLPKIRLGRKRKVRGYNQGPSTPDEYSRLLAIFELDDTATEAQLKAAYRQAVKDCHPDTAGDADPEKVARFRDLKLFYDRIMEIRSSLFGGA